MKKNKWSFLNALRYVKSKRRVTKPNHGFELQLIKYEHRLKNLNPIEFFPEYRS